MTLPVDQNKDEKLKRFVQILHNVLFFNTFSIDELYSIVSEDRLIKWKKFLKGNTVFKEGVFDQHFYIVIQGKMEVVQSDHTQKEAVVGIIQQGEIFGEMVVCAPDKPRRAGVRTASHEDAVVCEIDGTLVETAPAPLKAKFLKKFLDLILGRVKTAEPDVRFYEEIIQYATEHKHISSQEFFLYSVETAINENNRFTQYIKYTDFLVNRKIPAEQAGELVRGIIIKAVEKLSKSMNAV
ncbi:MAG: cyclic nucleotide-binding domain-containing protein [Desulfobacteraceae bacterium]|nr:MAG: cyclic nucleotide-binding domain-containing protein [Desulfobacteraceae bacterium]